MAVAINTSDLLGIVGISGKTILFATSDKGIKWNVPEDRPTKTENGTTSYIGIGPDSYNITITNINTSSKINSNQKTTNYTIPNDLQSGEYSIVVQPIDKLGNLGQQSTSVIFCIDKTPPPPLDPDSFQIIDDPLAQKTQGAATFRTKKSNCTISFAAVNEGNDEFASGVSGYRLYNEKHTRTDLTSNSITLPKLIPGPNNFTITAIDKMGIESSPIPLTIILPNLQPVS